MNHILIYITNCMYMYLPMPCHTFQLLPSVCIGELLLNEYQQFLSVILLTPAGIFQQHKDPQQNRDIAYTSQLSISCRSLLLHSKNRVAKTSTFFMLLQDIYFCTIKFANSFITHHKSFTLLHVF